MKEYESTRDNPLATGAAGPTGAGDPRQWVGYITGPANTPYEQRNFSFATKFPDEYPRCPFQLTFTTPLFYPNVSEEGEVRLADLDRKHWSLALTVRTVLLSLQALLSDPDLSEGVLNPEAATLYITNQIEYIKKARM